MRALWIYGFIILTPIRIYMCVIITGAEMLLPKDIDTLMLEIQNVGDILRAEKTSQGKDRYCFTNVNRQRD
jgi:hypothetical protein